MSYHDSRSSCWTWALVCLSALRRDLTPLLHQIQLMNTLDLRGSIHCHFILLPWDWYRTSLSSSLIWTANYIGTRILSHNIFNFEWEESTLQISEPLNQLMFFSFDFVLFEFLDLWCYSLCLNSLIRMSMKPCSSTGNIDAWKSQDQGAWIQISKVC